MKILHISDLHGDHLEKVPDDIDLIINTGDWLPNAMTDSIRADIACQERWLEQEAQIIKNWANDKRMLFVFGNHDRVSPGKILPKFGVRIIDITDKIYIHPESGLSFYGFPYIPFISGWWNHERELPEMVKEFDLMIERIKDEGLDQIDVFMAHCPPYGILDFCPRQCQHFGNRVLINRIDYGGFSPNYILCGHIHGAAGIETYNLMQISNAARSSQILDIE